VRISELSRESGVPTATIKYYLREGLLPPGERTSATQARYDAGHLARLRLIRALVGPARLSLATVRRVLETIDRPPDSALAMLGAASHALGTTEQTGTEGDRAGADRSGTDRSGADRSGADRAAARRIVADLGWSVTPDTPALADLAQALAAIEEAGLDLIGGGVQRYAEMARELADAEVATVPTDSPDAAIRQAVLGTVLIEPLLIALRRLALQDAAVRRFGAGS